MSDPIADMLTRLRNANNALLTDVEVNHSKLKESIAGILKREGYLADFSVEGTGIKKIKMKLKYNGRKGVIAGLKKVSKPGLRRYVGATEIPRVLNGMGISIVSTPKGVMTGSQAKKENVGGDLVAFVWEKEFMSRIGKIPVAISPKVKVDIKDRKVFVEGPKGKLDWILPRRTTAKVENNEVVVARQGDDAESKALHGLSRALINNMVKGVTEGYTKRLEIQGVGFKAAVSGKNITLNLGYSHPIVYPIPDQVKVTVEENTKITVEGPNKETVGLVASEIRSYYPPEPYKGKGVRYSDEQVKRKEGKTVQ